MLFSIISSVMSSFPSGKVPAKTAKKDAEIQRRRDVERQGREKIEIKIDEKDAVMQSYSVTLMSLAACNIKDMQQ